MAYQDFGIRQANLSATSRLANRTAFNAQRSQPHPQTMPYWGIPQSAQVPVLQGLANSVGKTQTTTPTTIPPSGPPSGTTTTTTSPPTAQIPPTTQPSQQPPTGTTTRSLSAQEIIQAEIDKALEEKQSRPTTTTRPASPPTSAQEIIQAEIDKALDEVRNPAPTPQGPVTGENLKQFFPNGNDAYLDAMAVEMNAQLVTGKIDTPERMAHFVGQVMQEVGSSVTVEENLNYSAARLPDIFGYFARNPDEAQLYGRTATQSANPEAIANRAYAGRIGNGDVASGDGWAFRGRGLKQLTGRANYAQFTDTHERLFGERIDFEANPDLLADPKYAVRSALAFWVDNGLPEIADNGVNQQTANDITAIINLHTDSYTQRWQNVNTVHNSGVFADL